MENENSVDTNVKTEEQIREEVKQEIEREEEIRQEVRDELKQENQEDNAKRKSKKIARIIWSIIMWAVFLFVLFEAVMGILNMKRLNEEKEPLWYLNTKVVEKDGKKQTSYEIGLYDIVKVEDSAGKRIILRPFFINED